MNAQRLWLPTLIMLLGTVSNVSAAELPGLAGCGKYLPRFLCCTPPDYCPKPAPPLHCPTANGCDDYCAKPLPVWIKPCPGVCPDTYCAKPLPGFIPPLACPTPCAPCPAGSCVPAK